jgi:hypothetical protein
MKSKIHGQPISCGVIATAEQSGKRSHWYLCCGNVSISRPFSSSPEAMQTSRSHCLQFQDRYRFTGRSREHGNHGTLCLAGAEIWGKAA